VVSRLASGYRRGAAGPAALESRGWSSELELREGWTTVLLLLAMLLCVAWSIQSAEWAEGLSILQGIVLVGGGAGVVLAKSRVPSRLAHPLSLLAGFAWAVLLTSQVVGRSLLIPGQEAVVELERQLRVWISVLVSGEAARGSFIFVLLLAYLLWITAHFCAWAIFRWQMVWWAVIVSGVALMINVTSANVNLTGFLIAFLLCALLLVVRTSVALYQQEWRMARVGYNSEVVYSFLRAGLVVSVLSILLAWVAPQALASQPAQEAWDKIGEPWRRFQDKSSRLFRDLNFRNPPVFVTYGRSMKFGGAVELADTPVLDIEAAMGRYWRVMVFHEYTGDGWNNTDTETIVIEENARDLFVPDFGYREEVTQTIILHQDLGPPGTLVAAGQPLRSNLPLRALVIYLEPEAENPSADIDPVDDGGAVPEPPQPGDASALYSQQELKAGQAYQVVSSLSRVDEESLRQAGTIYPDWVSPRYVQLPDSLPTRIRTLAEEVVEGQETPYDQALAIQRYLRDIPYNEGIDGPRSGQDGVDYFLFDAREGYCDYYSSAMVVMLRSLGVPARYVRGYSQGAKQEGLYRVLESDGHAWPEVFFPGYGWVEFEPTASEPLLHRSASQQASSPERTAPDRSGDRPLMDDTFEDPYAHEPTGPLPPPITESPWVRLRPWTPAILTLALLGVGAVVFLALRRHHRLEGLTTVERVYARLVIWVQRLLRFGPLAHQTPHEYAAAVLAAVPTGRGPIEGIVSAYVSYRFGGRTVAGEEVQAAWKEAQRAIWRSWLARVWNRLRLLPGSLARRILPPRMWQDVDISS
jgi:transglutaminase-like putative cysteine protease